MSVLDDYAETMIAPRISMVNGVSQVQVQGAQKYAVRVQVDPQKLQAEKIGLNEVEQPRCRTGTSTCRRASCSARTRRTTSRRGGQLMNADAFRPLVVAYRNGAPLRLSQVANVVDSVEDNKNASWLYIGEGRSQRVDQPVASCGSPAATPSKSRTRSASCCRRSAPSCRRPCTSPCGGDRSRNIREAFTDIQVTMVATLVLVVGGDLPLPAQRLRHLDSGARAAVLHPRHVRGDAGAWGSASTISR